MDSLSGELRVVGGSRKRRGVRRQGRRASCNSRKGKAGFDAEWMATAGGSAHTSAARAAGRKTDAKPAKPKAEPAGRAPKKGKPKPKGGKSDSSGKTRGHTQKGKAEQTEKSQKRSKSGGDGPIESLWEERVHLDGGEDLPADGPGFVDAVNEYVDLVRLTDSLLRERDEKSSKSLLEKLLEMKYGKGTKTEASGARPFFDLPGPNRE